MENKLLKELYDHFYIRPELDEQENEVEECHKALIAALEKPERKLELAWRLSAEVHNDENERSVSCRTRRAGARFIEEPEQ